MVNLRQIVFSIFTTNWTQQEPEHKSFVIVGAGSAGLAMLKTLSDFPATRRGDWDVTLFEQRRNVGGIWLPEQETTSPPSLPETPLYPRLHTNTPVPTMTYPGFPFEEGTPLYPSHEYIEDYHRRYADHHNLTSLIKFHHTVVAASWVGTPAVGKWNITYRDHLNITRYKIADHLAVATGNNHYPHIPHWRGEDDWLANHTISKPRRELLHTIWYRDPLKYANLSVLVVGYRASGSDVVKQVLPIAKKVYVSLRSPIDPSQGDIPEGVHVVPQISHFSARGITLSDGQLLEDVDAVILGTGYENKFPFLDNGGTIVTDPAAHSNDTHKHGLVTNLRYIFPLHKHILSLCPSYPPTALAFIGLPIFTANCVSDTAQSLYAVHAMLNPELLPSREDMLLELAKYEDDLRRRGFDPYNVGHRQLNGSSNDYMDSLIDHLKQKGALPDDGRKFIEPWRRAQFSHEYLKRGWLRVEELGTQDHWLRGVKTEAQWADMMERLNAWQREWETGSRS
ncbi:hypothetical protein EYR40_003915 [Pleurotus pulmonarius]|nr:hypothetical protein EYR40_003915 [Pleurotus pulmonarius]KAF4606622.1 hypothetical protein EYR38_000676 [Pleurotus pulmonarius]